MTREPVPEWCDVIAAKDQEISQIKEENAKLRGAIQSAIRQHEEGNKGTPHNRYLYREGFMKVELGKRYRTRDGRDVRIYAVDGGGSKPVHGAVRQGEVWEQEKWSASGEWAPNDMAGSLWDLVEVRPRIKREVWVNVYPHRMGVPHGNKAYVDTHRGADAIACVRVEIDVEEGHGL